MRQSGRIHWLVLGALAGLLLVGFIFVFGQESLDSVGARFMSALAAGDVDTLTKMSVLNGVPEDKMHQEWDFACHTAGKHYTFHWRITASMKQSDTSGSVSMQVMRNAATPGAYEEGFQLPLLKQDGTWKVDVQGISRQLYPGLPR